MLITIISDDRTYESLDGMPLVTNLNFTKNTSSADIEILMTNNPDLKLILTWRTLDSQPFYRHLWMSNCLDYPCIITDKRDLLNHSTAVVFHGIDWGDTPNYR